MKRTMSINGMTYEEKINARKERFTFLAEKAAQESNAQYKTYKSMVGIIPLGQPIHGQSDANYRRRTFSHMDKSYEALKKADYYREKAESVGTGGISVDDENAISKLEEKLGKLEELQGTMKAVNKALRLKDVEKGNVALSLQGYTEEEIKEIRTPNEYGRIGYGRYTLTNNSANIRSVKQRIKSLQQMQEVQSTPDEETGLYTYHINDNRCQFIFDGKPSDDVRSVLKSHAFKWSPSRGAWVRQATVNGIYAANAVKKELQEGNHGK